MIFTPFVAVIRKNVNSSAAICINSRISIGIAHSVYITKCSFLFFLWSLAHESTNHSFSLSMLFALLSLSLTNKRISFYVILFMLICFINYFHVSNAQAFYIWNTFRIFLLVLLLFIVFRFAKNASPVLKFTPDEFNLASSIISLAVICYLLVSRCRLPCTVEMSNIWW